MKTRFLAALSLSILLAPAAFAGRQPHEWKLVQQSQDMGLHTVYVTHDAAAIIGDRFGYHFLCKSPDWNVHCFRPAEKIEWIARLDGFSGRACFNPFGDPTPTGGPTVF